MEHGSFQILAGPMWSLGRNTVVFSAHPLSDYAAYFWASVRLISSPRPGRPGSGCSAPFTG